MSENTVIYKSPKSGREIGLNDGEWYTRGAGHELCIELGEEIQKLRARVEDLETTLDVLEHTGGGGL